MSFKVHYTVVMKENVKALERQTVIWAGLVFVKTQKVTWVPGSPGPVFIPNRFDNSLLIQDMIS